ncbi:MAG: glycosyltransferase [Anaerolineae bacterium]|nr:glycosyltransferase [Anaerolineae bacterium]
MISPSFSIVIPAYNAARTIASCLQALERQSIPRQQYEVIVVDDGSTDGTAEVVQRFIRARDVANRDSPSGTGLTGVSNPRPLSLITLIRQPRQGAAVARNAGACLAGGDFVLFLDADCVPADDWVERMISALQQDGVAGVGGVVRSPQQGLIPRFIQAEYDMRYERIARRPYTDFVSSGTAGYRRQVFAAVGGFAAELGGAEDTDLSFRLCEAGYRLVLEPEAVVYHLHPESLLAYVRRKFIYAYWRARVYQRHPQKVADDSRTPLSQKLQIGLVPLIALSLAAGLVWPFAWALAAALMGGFVLTAVPFVLRTLRRDPLVGLIALPLTLVSALAAAAGLMCGILRFGPSWRGGGQPGEGSWLNTTDSSTRNR